jgi:hypothetical protein
MAQREHAINTHAVLVGKSAATGLFGRQRCMWENIKINLIEIEAGCGVDPSGSGYGPVVSTYEHGNKIYMVHLIRALFEYIQ